MAASEGQGAAVEARDVREVLLYRAGIAVCAGAMVLALAASAGGPAGADWLAHRRLPLTAAVLLLTAGTGLSVATIHLYIRGFRALLRWLYAAGAAGLLLVVVWAGLSGRAFLGLLLGSPVGLVAWGPVLAALCGVAVKEAVCFGRIEAVLFATLTPLLVAGRLWGFLGPRSLQLLFAADTVLLCVFAVAKARMPVERDIGDKSLYT